MSFTLPPPYALDALEAHLSRRTLAAHHANHQAAYVAKTRALIKHTPLEAAALEDVVLSSAEQDTALFSASAQAWNHQFYWRSMRRGGGSEVSGSSAKVIEESFGSQRALSQQFVTVARISQTVAGDGSCLRTAACALPRHPMRRRRSALRERGAK